MNNETRKITGSVLVALMLLTITRIVVDSYYMPPHQAQPIYRAEAAPETSLKPKAQADVQLTASDDITQRLRLADLDKGRKTVRKCMPCHSLKKGGKVKIGPPLWGIVGSPIAAYFGYPYSRALSEHKFTWSTQELDAFLTNPGRYIPGTKMKFAGLSNPQDRADVIALLRRLSAGGRPTKRRAP